MRALLLVSLCLGLFGCSSPDPVDEFNTRAVTLPDGTTVKAEVMMTKADMARGMMFRDTLPEGRGMLFIHGTPDRYPYWMYQVNIPLDIVWMDRQKRIVEVVESAPPCKGKASECQVQGAGTYGGSELSLYVLELPGGYARKHGVTKGEFLRF
jgi:uncharacterized membrane protein (UPF0127 family)